MKAAKQKQNLQPVLPAGQSMQYVLIFCSGVCLMVGQYIASREIGSTYFSTDITLLAAVALSLLGNSLGYALAPKLQQKHIVAWGIAAFVMQLLLPISFRILVGTMLSVSIGWLVNLLVGAATLLFIGFYASFLPRVAGTKDSFCRLYAIEIAGGICGLSVLLLGMPWQFVLATYWLTAVVVLAFCISNKIAIAAASVLAVAAVFAYPTMDAAAASYFYAAQTHNTGTKVVATIYSPFQRVDVVDDAKGRALYLDGVEYYSTGGLTAFNHMLSEIPGLLLPTKGKALVIGSGSFSSSSFLKKQGFDVTTVEIDKAVADFGLKYFRQQNTLAPTDIHLVIKDARTYFAEHPDTKYDIIVMDVPAPFHIATGLLYTPEFYSAIRSHLTENGLACLCLCSDDAFRNEVSKSIAASACKVFGKVVTVYNDSAGLSFMYASPKALPFDARTLALALRFRAGGNSKVWEDDRTRVGLVNVPPVDKENLAAVLYMCRSVSR